MQEEPFLKNGYKLVRHFDQDDRQTDAAVWDSIRPVLLKAITDKGAHELSQQEWTQHIHQGSNKVRFEYCENSCKKTLAYLRAIHGHTRRMTQCSRIDETRLAAIQMERNYISERMFFQLEIHP